MDWWLASFFLGAILSLFLPIVPEFFVLFLLLLLSIVFFFYSTASKPLRLSSGLLFGMSWMLFSAFNFQHLWQDNNLNAIELSTKRQWVQGQVLSLHSPQNPDQAISGKTVSSSQRLRFTLYVTHINKQALNKAIQLRLSWENTSFPLQQGQEIQLKVKFKPTHGLANLGGFSYQTWLNSKKVSGTGYVINHQDNRVLSPKVTVRQQLFSRYQKLLPEHELAPLLLALGFGSRSELKQALWQVLQNTGTGHLIAISGLHIGLVATSSYFLIMLLVRVLPISLFLSPHQFQKMNIRYFAIGLSMVLALIYGYLAGFSLPTIRALLMLSLYWVARLLAIRISVKRWLLITLFLLTLTTPFSLFTASFWLSVYAVTIIFLCLWRFKRFISTGSTLWRFIKGLIVIQLSLTLMLLPISAVFFQQISVVALFANIFAVPWMSFLTIPFCLLSVLLMPLSESLSQFCIFLCVESLQIIWHYLSYLSNQSWATVMLTSFDVQRLVLVGLLGLYFLFFQAKPTFNDKHVATMLCCLMLMVSLSSFKQWRHTDHASIKESLEIKTVEPPNDWQVIVFDVGQGLSILIKHQHKAILYDTGASYASGFNMVDAVVLPYLQHAGIKQLDKVIISHSDNDHAGGLATLQQSIPINELIFNVNKEQTSGICQQGKSFYWQGLTFEMLWPEKIVAKENDDSCVVLISDGKHKVLLTGDISKKVEAKLMQQYPALRADILVVPHHGSKTSSSEAFIRQLSPTLAINSAGFLNRWRMPVAEVTKRYQKNNVQLVNSAETGQTVMSFSQKGMSKQTYQRDLWPFWFAN